MSTTEEQYKAEIHEIYKKVPCDFCGETPEDYTMFQHSVKQLDGEYKIYELKICKECGKIPEVQMRFLEYEKENLKIKSPLDTRPDLNIEDFLNGRL